MSKTYFVYADWTIEDVPRPFYVGKGSLERTQKLKRNNFHRKIMIHFGIDRRCVLATQDEMFAFETEMRLIEEHQTLFGRTEIGANFTVGGDGPSGRIVSLETRRKLSESKKGKAPNIVLTEEAKLRKSAKISKTQTGRKLSAEWKQAISDGMHDPVVHAAMQQTCSLAWLKKYENDHEFREKILRTRPRGEAHGLTKVTTEDVIRLRALWTEFIASPTKIQRAFIKHHATIHKMTAAGMWNILVRKTWKHV